MATENPPRVGRPESSVNACAKGLLGRPEATFVHRCCGAGTKEFSTVRATRFAVAR